MTDEARRAAGRREASHHDQLETTSFSRSKMRRVVLSAVLAGHCSAVLADGPTATAPDGTFNGARFRRSSAED